MVKWFWFSFSEDAGFLGGLICDGESFLDAHQNTHLRGINPGGEVKAVEMMGCKSAKDLKPYVPYRLYTKAEIEALDGAVRF